MTNQTHTVSISESVFSIAPTYVRILLLADGDGAYETPGALVEKFGGALESATERLELEGLAEDKHIAPWRKAYRAAGWNPGKFRSSIEALARRALRGELHPIGAALVDAGTIATLRHLVPIGVHVFDELPEEFPLVLGPATGSETFELFDGTTERPDPGEIIYKSGDIVLTRRWTWRQGRIGSVARVNRWLGVNIDIIEPGLVAESEVIESVQHLLGISGYQTYGALRIDSSSPTATFARR